MAEQEGGAKEIFQTIISHPALLVTVLLGGGLVVYLLTRNNAQSAGSNIPAGTASTGGISPDYQSISGAYVTGLQQGYNISPPQSSMTPPTSISPIPPPTTTTTTTTTPIPTATINSNITQGTQSTQQATTRGLWDSESNNPGLPIWSSPQTNSNWTTSGSVPVNTQLQITGSSVMGSYYGRPQQYIPVTYANTSGYILPWDLASTGGK